LLIHRYLIAIGIPVVLLLSGSVAKKLVRGTGWQRQDFFLGVQFTLAAMSAALVYLMDLAKLYSLPNPNLLNIVQQLVTSGGYLVLNYFLLLWVMSIHQDWERKNDNTKGQIIWLGIISNIIGAGLIIIFIIVVKGV